MIYVIVGAVALFIGAALGFMTAALLVAARRDDDYDSETND